MEPVVHRNATGIRLGERAEDLIVPMIISATTEDTESGEYGCHWALTAI